MFEQQIDLICRFLKKEKKDISDISLVKGGMTNHSITFQCENIKYIFRIPGEGTEQLINRINEGNVYDAIKDRELSNPVIYFDSNTGYKITEYIENARVCNPESQTDVVRCMQRLREFHEMKLKVEHEFDLFEQIQFYEDLRQGRTSKYSDYEETKKNIFSLQQYIQRMDKEKVLCHIDAVADNFLLTKDKVYMIDWEYAAMQDPHLDIAMFCIYSSFDKEGIDEIIDCYFKGKCPKEIRTKIYCYIAIAGLLWSNWCEYKSILGIEFGEYAVNQYRYAKEFFQIAVDSMK